MFILYKFLINCFILCNLLNEVSSFSNPISNNVNRCIKPSITNLNMKDTNRRDLLKKSLLISAAFTTNACIPYTSIIAKAFTIEEERNIKLFEKISPSVCYISTEYKNIAKNFDIDSNDIPTGVGSGIIWDKEGHVVTNFHVINKVDNATITLTDKNGLEKDYKVKITGIDPDKDIAVLKLDIKKTDAINLIPIELSSNKDIKIGQYSYAIGNPFGQDHSFSMGIVSAKNRELTSPTGRKIKNVIQTDTSINPGNSGGPLVDTSGKLIGMNTACMGMGVSSGVNFAVSIDTIKDTVEKIIKNGIIQRAILGISYIEKNPSKSEADKAGMPYINYGVIVSDVPETSPAYAPGLIGLTKNSTTKILGDVIVGIDKYSIKEPSDLMNVLDNYKPGDIIRMFTLRGIEKKPYIFDIKLGSFRVISYSGLEYENVQKENIPNKQLDIPLKDIAPQIKPIMPNIR